ncbi:MAG: DNA polymerase III subunit alpha, partial [Porphyromonadaceae bacterium]|nr:DNA polymerase III subunit alpha [Porphyromonadaceae bacterium]
VNESSSKFTVNKDGNIRFGLGAIKGVGENAVRYIVEEREKNGPFSDIFDFVQRVNLSACNRKNIENIAIAGGFDCFGISRECYLAVNNKNESFSETLIRFGSKYQADKNLHNNSLFGDLSPIDVIHPAIPETAPWSDLEKLNKEKDLIGIYLSAHPLDKYRIALQYGCNTTLKELDNYEALKGRDLTMGGIVIGFREGTSKNNKPFGVIKVEDYSGVGEIFLAGNDYINFHKFGVSNLYLYIRGSIEPRFPGSDLLGLKINSIELLPDVNDRIVESLTIVLPVNSISQTLIDTLSQKLPNNDKGKTKLYFELIDENEPDNTITLFARPFKISDINGITKFLIDSNIAFKINGILHQEKIMEEKVEENEEIPLEEERELA